MLRPCLDKPGRIWVMTGCVLLAVRMLLPFEWKVTKTIYISRIYPEITCFFNQTIQLPYLPAFPLYMVLLCFVAAISTVRLAGLALTQYRYSATCVRCRLQSVIHRQSFGPDQKGSLRYGPACFQCLGHWFVQAADCVAGAFFYRAGAELGPKARAGSYCFRGYSA